jgi:hypothetical protein
MPLKIFCQYYVHMHENGQIRAVETIPGIVQEG